MLYIFKPKLIPTLIFALIFPALIALGCWQLKRAQTKENWISTLQSKPMLSLTQALADPKQAQFHTLTLEGVFLETPTLLLMHQSQSGQHGVDVINIFKIKDSNRLILVDRGFIASKNPADIPPAPGQPMALHGIIDRPKPDRFILGSNILDSTLRPLPVQRLDEKELGELLKIDLVPLVLLANQNLGDGLTRNWAITPSMPPEKHMGYAVQWFALALCLAVIYIFVNLKKRPS